MVTKRQWADDLLKRLGATPNTSTEELLTAWADKEGTKARYNPLATTVSSKQPGETNFNSIGVKNFPNYQAGLDATVKTLRNGGYDSILVGLMKGDAGFATNAPGQFDRWGGSKPGVYSSSLFSIFHRVQSNWPAEGDQPLPSMPGAAGSADTSTLPGNYVTNGGGGPGLSDIPGVVGGVASAAGGLLPDIGGDIKSVLIFVVLLGGGIGLVLLGAKRAADPILPKVNPAALAAVA